MDMSEQDGGRENVGDEVEKDQSKAKGGFARAKSLSRKERSEIASKAATARWDLLASLPKATHGDPDHPLRIGDVEIPCYVLDDKRRVLHQRAMVRAIGIARGSSGGTGGDRLGKFASGKILSPYLGERLSAVTEPIKFRTPNNQIAYGYDATVLADLCEAVLKARRDGMLQKQQEHIAMQCEILLQGFARVGIIALVDEATGYQEVRDRQALNAFLDQFLRKEFAVWAKRFPDEYYKEIFRLRGWKWQGMKVNRPQVVAHYTKDIVYARLAPGVLKELEERNPPDEKGRRKAKHHQWLTEDIGHPRLAEHLYGVIGLMRAVPDRDWNSFKKMLDRAYPKRGDSLQLPLFTDEEFA